MDLRPRVFTAHTDPRTLEPDHSRRKNSGEFPVNISLNSLATGDGLFGTADDRDITGRIQEDEKFQALLESAPHAMVIVDQTGTIILVNSQSEKLFGFSHEDLLGKSIELLLPERYRGHHVQQRERFFRAPRLRPMDHSLELYGLRADGSEFPAQVSLSPWETGKGTYVCPAIRELSDKEQTEDQLWKLWELEARNSELAATNRQFETFSYSVAHDLRTPLRQIEQSAKLLLEQPSSLTPAQRQCLEQIPLVALQIAQLMATVLSYARLGGTSLAREDVDLRELVEDVISSLASETHQRKVSWCVNPLSHAHCDRILMRQVFCSLLANALKFTRIREHAVIEVGETRVTGERVFFTRDNGVGFDVKYTDELSAIFQRVQPEEEFEATGVGLAMVQRIIAKHGGRIWVRSEPGSGSTFFFTLGPEPAAELG